MSHKCPTANCPVMVDNDSKLMCRDHWFELPLIDRRAIYDSFERNGHGQAHIQEIKPLLDLQRDRLYPRRNQGRPFGL